MTTTEQSSGNDPGFEVCPVCSQRTAVQYLRKVGDRTICFLCAGRMVEDVKRNSARALNDKYHGNGWIWKHVAWCAGLGILIALSRFRMLQHIFH